MGAGIASEACRGGPVASYLRGAQSLPLGASPFASPSNVDVFSSAGMSTHSRSVQRDTLCIGDVTRGCAPLITPSHSRIDL